MEESSKITTRSFGESVISGHAKITTVDLLDVANIEEDVSLEVKEAAGRSGNGECPKSFLETYSAMANTRGGIVLFGIKEKPKGSFSISGINDCPAVLKQLWDFLNDRTLVNINLLTDDMVSVFQAEGKSIIKIVIPRAKRFQRPVFTGTSPLTGTFRRNFEGDYLCDAEEVKRMFAEQVEETRDSRLLEGFGIDDLNVPTLHAYRQQFKSTHPVHPWLTLSDTEFLRNIGAWAVDRSTNSQGPTLGGLLMFGKLPSILEAAPNYIVDYQEREGAKADQRWSDRLTTDGTWSGNLFDFFRMTMTKLTVDLKVPFKLRGVNRVDDSPVHEALREAFVNAIIHADYSGRPSVLVVKRPDLFGFRNPGMMRISMKDALQGGTSDCRNRNLQKMFQLAGLGEQAGSGVPKIFVNWNQQHWRKPSLVDMVTPEQTVLTMQMLSLIPDETLEKLREKFGTKFETFSDDQRLALVTAHLERSVTHARLKEMSTSHSRDITLALAGLVKDGTFETDGAARGTTYFFAGEKPSDTSESIVPFDSPIVPLDADAIVPLVRASVPLDRDSVPLPPSAISVSKKKKASSGELRCAISDVCKIDFVPLRTLAKVLNRKPEYLRIKHLNAMVEAGLLIVRYPDSVRHPQQGYRAVDTDATLE